MTGWQLPLGAPVWQRQAEVVVVGSGAAGLAATTELVAAGREVVLLTRAGLTDSATAWAQGGLAAVWAAEDTAEQHVADTLAAGAGLCDEVAVRELVAQAPAAIRRLMALGARFDTGADGQVDLHLEGGHHARRILHSGGDRSGEEVERVLAEALGEPAPAAGRLEVLVGTRLVDVLTDASGAACGVTALDAQGRPGQVRARAVVLATGGIGQLWPTTTNPAVATGDGLAAALRAGATGRDLEFLQFHPTVLVVPEGHRREGDRGVLVSEAVRGEGAVLVDGTGRRVMAGVHPLGDLAPRDVVSAAEQAHLLATGEPHLLLDATGFGEQAWAERFPSILRMCRERGVDPVTEPVPVRPGAHYHCGGVAATMDGTTSVPGLLVVGEAACTGAQGANRLASNSVTEALVMGHRAARLLAAGLPEPGVPVAREPAALVDPASLPALQQAVQQHAGVLREHAGLVVVQQLADALPSTTSRLDGAGLDATNLALVARVVVVAALARTESRGCHRRADHPGPDEAWRTHLDVVLDTHGAPLVRRAAPSSGSIPSTPPAAAGTTHEEQAA